MDLNAKDDLNICQHKENCCSKEPTHFEAYLHPHLDKIYANGRDDVTKEYVIPDELTALANILQDQLNIIEKSLQGSNQNEITVNSQSNTKTDAEIIQEAGAKESTDDDLQASEESDDNERECYFSCRDIFPVTHEPGNMLKKLEKAWPYNIFLTAIKDLKSTHNEPLTITFQEIFDESLGEIESTVQINYMVDFNWLIMHYALAGILDKPLLVLYGTDKTDGNLIRKMPNLTSIEVKMPFDFGLPHAKISIISYTDNTMRLVISTANLYLPDWRNMTQAVWISPKLKPIPTTGDARVGESSTNFRSDFIGFLHEYKCSNLKPWIERIRRTDFSEINVVFIASAPGMHSEGWRGHLYGHPRLGYVLQKHCAPINENIPVVCQSSGVGGYGPDIESWIQHDFLSSAGKDTQHTSIKRFPPLNFIFPSIANVAKGVKGFLEHAWLPYEKSMNDKQLWLRNYMYQWIADGRHRTGAIPHMKTYARFDADEKCVFWFLLTSANFSKSAWGTFNKKFENNPQLRINSYEAGVLFLPKFVTGEQTFPLDDSRNDILPFPLPYDVPLKPYELDDSIYTKEATLEFIEQIYKLRKARETERIKNEEKGIAENKQALEVNSEKTDSTESKNAD